MLADGGPGASSSKCESRLASRYVRHVPRVHSWTPVVQSPVVDRRLVPWPAPVVPPRSFWPPVAVVKGLWVQVEEAPPLVRAVRPTPLAPSSLRSCVVQARKGNERLRV